MPLKRQIVASCSKKAASEGRIWPINGIHVKRQQPASKRLHILQTATMGPLTGNTHSMFSDGGVKIEYHGTNALRRKASA